MQTLAFLSFELQIAQQRLRETFTESPVPSKALNWNSLSGRAFADPDRAKFQDGIGIEKLSFFSKALKPGSPKSFVHGNRRSNGR